MFRDSAINVLQVLNGLLKNKFCFLLKQKFIVTSHCDNVATKEITHTKNSTSYMSR